MSHRLDLTFTCASLQGEIVVASATIHEAISTPSRAAVHLLAQEDLDGEPAIGQPAHLQISIEGEPVRDYHLVVVSFELAGSQGGKWRRYTIELVHELWLLTLRTDARIFQEKDAQEIAAAVLDGAGIAADHVTWSLQRTPVKRTYCVQYRETDLAFMSRLLEHEGIFYFIHDDGASTHVTFADAQGAFPPVEGDPVYSLIDEHMHGGGVHELVLESRALPDKVTLGDYNFETPGVELTSAHQAPEVVGGDWFEYAAGHRTQDEGAVLARIRYEEIAAGKTVGHGRSDLMAMRAGSWFELEGPSREALAGKYLVRSVEHRVVIRPREGDARDAYYENDFTCIPCGTPFRPPRAAPRAGVLGAHSAVVTGPSGEIHADPLGRMKGKFFWDRLGKDDDTSSCWMRVAQLPIGGSMALARVGWEMSVGYFDGDPDRPIAIHRLYTAERVPPYTYPAAKTRMALQTLSSPASGKSNEIRMEDGAGGMQLFVNASKDYDSKTNNNKTEDVGVDERVEIGVDAESTVGASETISVGANETTSVSSDMGLVIGGSREETVGASETVTVSGNLDTSVTGSDTETTGGSHTTLAALGVSKTAKGAFSLTVGGSMVSASGLGVGLAVAGARSETIGGASISASGTTVTETVVGALARTVGGVMVQAAGANRLGTTKGPAAITVGGVACASAGGKIAMKAKKISIKVAGMANLLGGGGIINLTPGWASFVGLVTLDASGSITISGNPNLVG